MIVLTVVLGLLKAFRHQRVFYSLLVLPLFLGTQVVAGEPSAQQWLEKMSSALQETSYQGVFVYRRDQDISAMKVTHIISEQGEYELLETLTGEPRREIRDAAQNNLLDNASPLLNVGQFYDLQVLGLDRVAGRMALLLKVDPKDEFRYGYRLWLDQETGLLLRSELLGVNEVMLEQVMFTSLELLSAEQGQAILSERKVMPTPKIKPEEESLVWMISQLPSGFKLLDHRIKGGEKKVEHMVFSDGLASVSVFVEGNKASSDTFVGVSTMGAVNAFGSTKDGFQVTVVGEVPKATVLAIGQSIERQTESPDD